MTDPGDNDRRENAGAGHPSGDERFDILEREITKDADPGTRLSAVLDLAFELFGSLPDGVVAFIALKSGLPLMHVLLQAEIRRPKVDEPEAEGEHQVMVCTGTACYVRGAEAVLNRIRNEFDVVPNEATPDGFFVLKTARCLGICGKAPVMMVDEDVYEFVDPDKAMDIIRSYRAQDSHPRG
jgi:NADH:ubiquinone oxidoreductase subunit E